MLTDNKISIYDFVHAISKTVDLVSPALNSHHCKVTYLAYKIAQEIGLPAEELQDIVLASMLHDIGMFSIEERLEMLIDREKHFDVDLHALIGYKLLKDFEPLANAATLIKNHQTNYNSSTRGLPLGSHIIHVADRIAILLDDSHDIFTQTPRVIDNILHKKHLFHPEAFAAFLRLSEFEYIWLEVFSSSLGAAMANKVKISKEITEMYALRSFAKVFAQIIDFRSRFTATHSSGVAAVAYELAAISGFSEKECRHLEIAGFLHDLGKLAVPNAILEKNGALNSEEINHVRKHTYYTYSILSSISGLEHIAEWAAYHHEKLDGNGYPFHINHESFSKMARIMAVADIVTALTEDRPYRIGVSEEKAADILGSMVEKGAIDKAIVGLAVQNFRRINDARIKAQNEALIEYEAFNDYSIPEEREIVA